MVGSPGAKKSVQAEALALCLDDRLYPFTRTSPSTNGAPSRQCLGVHSSQFLW